MEIWKDIPNTNGYYQVSNLGRVRSVKREVVCYNGTIQHHKGRVLSASENGWGYLQVGYPTVDGKHKTSAVHRLVAMVFLDGYVEGLEVNHKDENKHNNFVFVNEDGTIDASKSNLEWCSREYNNGYGSNPINRSESYKKNSYTKRTKIIVVYRDGVKVGEYNGYKEAGEALGYTKEYVSFLANGQRKSKHIRVETKRSRSYQIGVYKEGELIATYSSLAKATKAIGVNWHLDRKYIGDGKTIHGYTLREII